MTKNHKFLFLLPLVALLLTACGSTTPTSATGKSSTTPTPSASPSNPYGAAPVDPPAPTEPILTLSNGARSMTFTMANLLSLGTSEISIYEPFVKLRQSFSVIPLTTLFGKVGISPTDKVVTKALNDYVYTNTAAKFISANGYLAIKRNGADIPYDQGGPIRIVFPDSSSWSHFLDPWNWSLSSISVK
jgi:hypothetical protein